MAYMGNPAQKNFVLPPALKAKWEALMPKGSQVSSRKGAGVLFLTTIADAEGRFIFENVPPGRYYLTTVITWEIPSYGSYTQMTGGVVCKRIEVDNGERVDVILTR